MVAHSICFARAPSLHSRLTWETGAGKFASIISSAVLIAALFTWVMHKHFSSNTCLCVLTRLGYLPVLEVLNIEAFPWYLPVVH